MAILLACISHILPSYAQPMLLNAVYPYPSEEQHCLLIDKQGLIWIGSNAGIKSYDGYRFKSYRSNATTPNILPSNNVLCMTEGNDDVLWIGTRNGLVSMDTSPLSSTVFHTTSALSAPSGHLPLEGKAVFILRGT